MMKSGCMWLVISLAGIHVTCGTGRPQLDTETGLPLNIPEEIVVAWFPFDGDSDDRSITANEGVPNAALFKPAHKGMGLFLTGVESSFVYFADREQYHIYEPTVEAWIRLEGTSLCNTIVAENIQGADADGRGFIFDIQNDRVRFAVGDGSGQWKYVAGATPLALNSWYHVVGVYRSGRLQVFVNGKLDGANGVGPIAISYTPDRYRGPDPSILYVGIRYTAKGSPPNYTPDLVYPFFGIIDEVRVYNRGLTDSEIRLLYQVSATVH